MPKIIKFPGTDKIQAVQVTQKEMAEHVNYDIPAELTTENYFSVRRSAQIAFSELIDSLIKAEAAMEEV